MSRITSLSLNVILSGLLTLPFALVTPAMALQTTVTYVDLARCDPLAVPKIVDELGLPPTFPIDEEIAATDITTTIIACPAFDTPLVNVLVTMQNNTGRAFDNVWYVADPETSLSNVDGLVNGEFAFRIDSPKSDPGGSNHPLAFESIAANDIFEPLEVWQFIIDDYANANGLPASAFGSGPAVGSFSGNDSVSSGSIVATPEPTTALLVAMGLSGLALLRRRQTS